MFHCVKTLDYLCNCKSDRSNICKAVEGHCLQAMKIMHHYANGRFDWSISEQQCVNPPREATSILSHWKKITETQFGKNLVFTWFYKNVLFIQPDLVFLQTI